jgi:hypothetical protein
MQDDHFLVSKQTGPLADIDSTRSTARTLPLR